MCSIEDFMCRFSPISKRTNVVCNFVDVTQPENLWYVKLLLPEVLPLTCVFSSSGNLIDLIPGFSRESMLYIEDAISNDAANLDFHYNRRYNSDKLSFIRYANIAIRMYLDYTRKDSTSINIDSLYQIVENPYLLYLKASRLLAKGDTINARHAASKFLSCDSAIYFIRFHKEFLYANHLVDPSYTWDRAPVLDLSSQVIDMGTCDIFNSYPISFSISNIGYKPLEIAMIYPSCSCIKLAEPSPQVINPHCSATISATIAVDVEGYMEREIHIISNDKVQPLHSLTVIAHVK